MRKRHLMTTAGLLALAFMLIPDDVWARGRGGGGFSRGGSRGFFSSSRGSRGSSWGSRSSRSTNRLSSVAKPKGATPADKQAYQSASKTNPFNKKSFSKQSEARKAAKADFKQRYASQYKSQYNTEPTTRPEHIPKTVEVNGRSQPVEWRQVDGVGGYYYPGPTLGQWIMYDIMAHSLMRDRYMYRHGYDPTGSAYVNSYWSFERILWISAIVIVVLVIGYAAYTRYANTGGWLTDRTGNPQNSPMQGTSVMPNGTQSTRKKKRKK